MKITYDPEADALYIQLRSTAKLYESEDLEEGVVADFDEEGHIIGLEVLDASDRLTLDDLSNVTYEDLVTEKQAKLHLPVAPAPPWKNDAPKT
jgi:uncharacterized protein YuzE